MGASLGDLRSYALIRGRQLGLENYDGTWRCHHCDAQVPFHESLACEGCRRSCVARKRVREATERALDDESYRWRGMWRALRKNDRLDRDAAVRLLDAARKLPSATVERMQRLNEAFDRRFDSAPAPGTYVVEYPEGDPAEDWDRG